MLPIIRLFKSNLIISGSTYSFHQRYTELNVSTQLLIIFRFKLYIIKKIFIKSLITPSSIIHTTTRYAY